MWKKLTKEEFIEEANKIHNIDKIRYTYEKVNYKNLTTDIEIFCNSCKKYFLQVPATHLRGSGCRSCSYKKRADDHKISKEDFIEKANLVHNQDKIKYTYEKVIFEKTKKPVQIFCVTCQEYFNQKPNSHMNGQGCPYCALKENQIRQAQKTKTTEQFIKESNEIHNFKYDYSLTDYRRCNIKVKIICHKKDEFGEEHGIFEQQPLHHTSKIGCPKCGGTGKLNTEAFIKKANKVHNCFYTYEKTIYKNNSSNVIITCPKHGDFSQNANSHLHKEGCPSFRSSKGERSIKEWLKKNNIKFISQKKFEGCKHKKSLFFDFYLPEYNLCIEFDGTQHYEVRQVFGRDKIPLEKAQKNFDTIQKRDQIKTYYCKNNNIGLLRIPYWEFKNIEKILYEEIILKYRKEKVVKPEIKNFFKAKKLNK